MGMKKLFAEIAKTEAQDDGTIKVWGYASTGAVDSDGEIITPEAMKAALPGYLKFGAVREMHQPSAAGTCIEAEVREDGKTWFGAHVVDPVAVKKVEAGVYKGFSIGARRVQRDAVQKHVIKGFDLTEVSLVDRPANPEAVITMFKVDGGEDQPDEQPAAEAQPETIEKGLWNVQRLMDALTSVRNMCTDVEFEVRVGEHTPEMLAEIKAARDALAAIAQKYLGEEVALMTSKAEEPAATKAEESELAKAGRRFSAATKAALKAAHEACKAADKALADLKYDADEAEEKGADKAEQPDTAKAEQVTELAKAAGLELAEPTEGALLKAAVVELVALRKAHAELLATPAAAKGAVRAVAIEKAADRDPGATEVPPVKVGGEEHDVATLVKAAHARPIRLA